MEPDQQQPPEPTLTPPEVPVTPTVAPVQPVANTVAVEDPGKTLGLVSFILSLVGGGAIAIILGILGLHKSKNAGHKNTFALAGIIIGSIATIISFLFVVLFIIYAMNNEGPSFYLYDTSNPTPGY